MYYNEIFYIDSNVIKLVSLEILLNSIMQFIFSFLKLIFNKKL